LETCISRQDSRRWEREEEREGAGRDGDLIDSSGDAIVKHRTCHDYMSSHCLCFRDTHFIFYILLLLLIVVVVIVVVVVAVLRSTSIKF